MSPCIPGPSRGFGQLGREGVPTFLLPANPVSALVVFEVMVRPLIRLSLGKRQPLRRVVQARTLSPITSVAGRKGYLRGQLMRDQDSGEYLVTGAGRGSGGVIAPAGPRLPRQIAWSWCPPGRADPHRRDRRRRIPGSARLVQWDLRAHSREPGRNKPPSSGLAGVCGAAAGRCGGDPAAGGADARWRQGWSRTRLADRAHLEPWEPSADGDWTVRHTVAAWPVVCSSLRAEADRGRMLPYVIELDGQFCGQFDHRQCHARGVAIGVDRLLGDQLGDRRRGGHRRTGVGSGPLLRSGDAASRRGHRAPGECGEPGRAGKGRGSAKRVCCAVTSRWTGRGGTICWWPSPQKRSMGQWRRPWSGAGRASWP